MKTIKEKRAFIRALTRSIEKSLLEDVPRVPPEWDGYELRQLIADTFAKQAPIRMGLARLKNYKNEVRTRGL